MIFIVVKWTIRPERSGEWLTLVDDFTQSTRGEPGNIDDAAAAHVNSDHFKAAMAWMPDVVAETPDIINVQIPGDNWSKMAEVTPSRG